VNSFKPIIKVGIVAGEYSGDRLGSKIISALKKTHNVELYGVGGPKIIKEGLTSIFNFEKLHLMGLIEPLINYIELKKLRKQLINLFTKNKIDYFIGIDSPDFNIGIHKALKNIGISKNIQVVSPSVWGWREGRIKHIKNFIDLTMCLFNFEHNFYKKKEMPSIHIGHPFCDLYPSKKEDVFQKYSLKPHKQFVSILPGSRKSEIKDLLPTYIDFINLHFKDNINCEYLIPASDLKIKELITSYLPSYLPIRVEINSARDFLSISEFSVVTSGTATLESAILGVFPIICYKTNPLNFFIISRMLKVDDVGLPNLLLDSRKFPELIQKNCNPKSILNASKNTNNMQPVSAQLRELLAGTKEEDYIKKILEL
jgi:lipid-A-disaccharide synthase